MYETSSPRAALLARVLATILLTTCLPALAQHRDREHERMERYRGHEIHRFHEHDMGVWRRGHWYHGDHDGRLGWWWIAAGIWYFYPQPVYPYPDPYAPPVLVTPPVVVVPPAATAPPEPPAAPEFWYYCESANAYYPYVATCPEAWKKVPAKPPGVR